MMMSTVVAAGLVKTGGWRLADSPSPYLQMHADNQVEWYPWGEAAFARARAENKPIFLSIGYATCYWCHVMERESFMDIEVAKVLNAHFISIKVDREARPDVDEIYMTAVQLLQGQGGWPMSTLLTPERKPFFGGTYFPRAQFLQLLQSAEQAWSGNRQVLEQQAQQVAAAVAAAQAPNGLQQVPGGAVVSAAVSQLRSRYDAKNGGFGGAPKFPTPSQLVLLLDQYAATGQQDLLDMVRFTLTQMARGGIHDQLGLGFHRYSTDAQWLLPHFEKMLYDNAQLLHLYARAFALTGDLVFARAASDIVALLETTFRAPDGLWYAAIDAETAAEEGRYYVWTRAELQAALSASEWQLAAHIWGLEGKPNFADGRFVLAWVDHYDASARALKLSLAELFERVDALQEKLRKLRSQRQPPRVDEKIVVGWNGLAIDALAYASVVLKKPAWHQRARSAAQALLAKAFPPAGLAHMLRDGQPHGQAVLEDYAGLLLGLTGLDAADAKPSAATSATRVADEMLERLWDAVHGGFFDAQATAVDLIVRPRAQFDGAIPSGNSLAAQALLRLVKLGESGYQPRLAALLASFGGNLRDQPGALTAMTTVLAAYYRAGGLSEMAPPALASIDSASKVQASVRTIASDHSVIHLQIAAGWHINAHQPKSNFLIPTDVQATRAEQPIELMLDYPAPAMLEAGWAEGPLAVYRGDIDIHAKATRGNLEGSRFRLHLQACDDHGVCLAPATLVVPK